MAEEIQPLIENLDNVDQTDIPPWASVIIQSMKGILTLLNSFQTLSNKIEELDSIARVSENASELLRSDLEAANAKISELENKLDDQEQRSRNQCLLFHGINESDGEDTDTHIIETVKNNLNIQIERKDISLSHRLGPKKQATGRSTRQNHKREKPRPIIVRFNSFRDRTLIFKNKKMLKGKPLAITENLTKRRMELPRKATAKFGKGNCWSQEGRIFTKVNDSFIVIESEAECIYIF